MKTHRHSSGPGGFTLVELLLVMAIIGVLVALLLPSLSGAKQTAHRISCVNNLRQIGIAFHGFAHDHNNRFPMQVPVAHGGSMEFVPADVRSPEEPPAAYPHFQPLAGMLVMPAVLVCPSDTRLPAPDFATLRDQNLSYFVALSARFGQSTMVLAGDHNMAMLKPHELHPALREVYSSPHWANAMHGRRGNLLFADGRVEHHAAPTLPSGPGPGPIFLALPAGGARTATPPEAGDIPPRQPAAAGVPEPDLGSPQLPASGKSAENTVQAHARSSGAWGAWTPMALAMAGLQVAATNPTVLTSAPPPTAEEPAPVQATPPTIPPPQPAATQRPPWLWLLLLLLLLVTAVRFWQAWRRYSERRAALGG